MTTLSAIEAHFPTQGRAVSAYGVTQASPTQGRLCDTKRSGWNVVPTRSRRAYHDLVWFACFSASLLILQFRRRCLANRWIRILTLLRPLWPPSHNFTLFYVVFAVGVFGGAGCRTTEFIAWTGMAILQARLRSSCARTVTKQKSRPAFATDLRSPRHVRSSPESDRLLRC